MKSCYDSLPDGYHELLTVDLQKNKRLALLVNGLALLIAILMVLLGAYLVPLGTAVRDIHPFPSWRFLPPSSSTCSCMS